MKQSLEAVQGDWTPVGDGDDHDDDDHVSNRQQQEGLTQEDMQIINNLDQSKIVDANDDGNGDVRRWNESTRLCWVRDPLKMLDFD
jgi:hypothetical protein